MNDFELLFSKYDTDKVTGGYYGELYNELLSPVRNKIKLLFEIGVNRGGSVRAFKEYFPQALIVGLEINKNCYFEDDRIKVEIGDATNSKFIDTLISKYGCPDIVIDDGSHMSRDIKISFDLLYPHTKIYYIIEDLCTQTSTFEGGIYINDGIPATKLIYDKINTLLLYKDGCKAIKLYYAICAFIK